MTGDRDHPQAAAWTMLGEDQAKFLAAEVLASSVLRSILCRAGRRFCT
jgi:hypothetical protein